MGETPSGPMGGSLSRFRAMIAASSAFRAWVGAANAEEAAASIYIEALGPVETAHVMIDPTSYALQFWAPISAGYRDAYEDAFWEFTNAVGTIVKEIALLSGGDGYLSLARIGRFERVGRGVRDTMQPVGVDDFEWLNRADEDDLNDEGAFYMGVVPVEVGI